MFHMFYFTGKGEDNEAVPVWESTVLNDLSKELCSCRLIPTRVRGRGLLMQEFPGAVTFPGRREDAPNSPAPLCAMRTEITLATELTAWKQQLLLNGKTLEK